MLDSDNRFYAERIRAHWAWPRRFRLLRRSSKP